MRARYFMYANTVQRLFFRDPMGAQQKRWPSNPVLAYISRFLEAFGRRCAAHMRTHGRPRAKAFLLRAGNW